MIKHRKEQTYFTISLIASIGLWLVFLISTMGLIIPLLLLGGLITAYTGQIFRAYVLGHAVKVSDNQYEEINKIIIELSNRLNLKEVPDTFIFNGEGTINAFAIRLLSKKYIVLYSGLVDLLLSNNQMAELKVIIAHELAHHAAGHTSPLKHLLLFPSSLVPFLGAAYSRACEYTADKIALDITGSRETAKRALAFIALGSQVLSPKLNIKAFAEQEKYISKYFGFVTEIYSTHPRITARIIELDKTELSGKFQTQIYLEKQIT